jgi:hypothetical protein
MLLMGDDQAAPEYLLGMAHSSASSSEVSACSVEVGSTKDVGEIVRHPDLFAQASSDPHLLSFVSWDQPEHLLR